MKKLFFISTPVVLLVLFVGIILSVLQSQYQQDLQLRAQTKHSTNQTTILAQAASPGPTLITPTIYCVGGAGVPPCAPIDASPTSGPTIPMTGAPSTTVSPSMSASPTSGSTSPSPTVDPCSQQQNSIFHDKGKKKKKFKGGNSGGFIEMLMKFFMWLIEYILKGGNIPPPTTGPEPTSGAEPTDEPSPSDKPEPTTNPCPDPTESPAPSEDPSPTDEQPSTAPTTGTTISPTTSDAPGQQTLGCGGIFTPAAGPNVVQVPAGSPVNITSGGTAGNPKIYDGGCNQVGKVTISASYVVVQNMRVCPNGQYGIYSNPGSNNVTIQNNDIKCVQGPGDLNAITFFGNNINILYNTAEDWVVGDPGDSHTDFIQTWNNDPGESSSNVVIKGNRATGPLQGEGNFTIHQCIMAQGKAATDGGGGGDGNSQNWLITDNYFKDDWNQCIKLEDIDNAHVTRNTFAGASDRVIEIRTTSEGTLYYSDNVVSGTYGSVGATITNGPGPSTIPGL